MRRLCCWKEMRMMTKPVVSRDLKVEDIRKIRGYNSLRHIQMSLKEIMEDARRGAAIVLERLKKQEKLSL